MKKAICIASILSLGFLSIFAQQYTHQVSIKQVNSSGLYKIALKQDVKKLMSVDLHDTRIVDSGGKEIPYMLLSETLLKSKSDFIQYQIVSQKHFKNHTEVVIANPNKDKVNNMAFNINNSDAFKYCAIEGSDDQKQWYSISEQQELSLIYNTSYTNTFKCIYFPLSNYNYFKLIVDDWFSEPLKINSAGFFKNALMSGKLDTIATSKTVTEDKKNKTTTVAISQVGKQIVNRIDFKVSSPRLFCREASIYVLRERKTRKRRTEMYKEYVCSFELNSNKSLFFDVTDLAETKFYIEIKNKDNPPLQFESISCMQLASYLVADFDANNRYSLLFGNSKLKQPEYDIANFVNSTPHLLPNAQLGQVKELVSTKQKETASPRRFFETKLFLWLCVGIGAIVILVFSRGILKDMGKKGE